MPDFIVSLTNSPAYSFVWQNKRERLACSTVTQRPSQGGLCLVDFNRKISSLHVMWIRHLVEESNLPSLFYFKHHLRAAFAGRSIEQILMLPAPSKSALSLLPPFYRSIMVSWFHLTRTLENG